MEQLKVYFYSFSVLSTAYKIAHEAKRDSLPFWWLERCRLKKLDLRSQNQFYLGKGSSLETHEMPTKIYKLMADILPEQHTRLGQGSYAEKLYLRYQPQLHARSWSIFRNFDFSLNQNSQKLSFVKAFMAFWIESYRHVISYKVSNIIGELCKKSDAQKLLTSAILSNISMENS